MREGLCRSAEIAEALRAHLATAAPLGRIDYVEIVDPVSLSSVGITERPVVVAVAVRFPSARLIDNIRVDPAETAE